MLARASALALVLSWASVGRAQAPAPAPYPYGYPPPGGYAYQPPPQQPPPVLPYQEGAPIPAGYRLEERPLTGLIVGGAVTIGVPYLFGIAMVAPAHFPNESQWLVVPVLGPWMSLGARKSTCRLSDNAPLCGLADFGAGTMYALDGIMQAGGAAMLIVGIAVTRRRLVRSDVVSFDLLPMRIGTGYGLGAVGTL